MRNQIIRLITSSTIIALAGAYSAQAQDAKTLGILEQIVGLLQETNAKLDDLVKKPGSGIPAKRAAFYVDNVRMDCGPPPVGNADTEFGCRVKAAQLCANWGYPKYDYLNVGGAPNVTPVLNQVICFD